MVYFTKGLIIFMNITIPLHLTVVNVLVSLQVSAKPERLHPRQPLHKPSHFPANLCLWHQPDRIVSRFRSFLVSFMWMLMEGVFLYLALVRVFLTNTRKYATVFTATSYCTPLLYLSLITLPISFSTEERQYGYSEA